MYLHPWYLQLTLPTVTGREPTRVWVQVEVTTPMGLPMPMPSQCFNHHHPQCHCLPPPCTAITTLSSPIHTPMLLATTTTTVSCNKQAQITSDIVWAPGTFFLFFFSRFLSSNIISIVFRYFHCTNTKKGTMSSPMMVMFHYHRNTMDNKNNGTRPGNMGTMPSGQWGQQKLWQGTMVEVFTLSHLFLEESSRNPTIPGRNTRNPEGMTRNFSPANTHCNLNS